MASYKVLGMTGEGECQHCGTHCPRRRVAVQAVDAGGAHVGGVQYWGVVCAGQARYGSRSAANGARIQREAAHAAAAARLETIDQERRIQHRTAGPVDAGLANNPKAAANDRYRRTGRPLAGSYLAADLNGGIVRIDGNDPADVATYAGRGYVLKLSRPMTADTLPAQATAAKPIGPIGRMFAAAIVRTLDAAATVAADWRDALAAELKQPANPAA